MTLTELEKLEALHAAATPGEWGLTRWRSDDEFGNPTRFYGDLTAGTSERVIWSSEDGGVRPSDEDAESVIAIHNAFPALAEALRKAWEKIEDQREEALVWLLVANERAKKRNAALSEIERLKALVDAKA